MDYNQYTFGKLEWFGYALRSYCIIAIILYLMYKSIIVCILGIPIIFIWMKAIRKALIKKRKQQLLLEFREFLYSLIVCLGSGYSIENGIPQILRDMDLLYPEGSYMTEEIKIIQKRLQLGEQVESAFTQFSERANTSAIAMFVSSLSIGLHQGGNLVDVLKENSNMIIDQVTIQQEIEVIIAEKQFEIKFLSLFPFLIVGLLNLSSPDFMRILYVTWVGRIGMTIAMMIIGTGIYFCRYLLSQHLG